MGLPTWRNFYKQAEDSNSEYSTSPTTSPLQSQSSVDNIALQKPNANNVSLLQPGIHPSNISGSYTFLAYGIANLPKEHPQSPPLYAGKASYTPDNLSQGVPSSESHPSYNGPLSDLQGFLEDNADMDLEDSAVPDYKDNFSFENCTSYARHLISGTYPCRHPNGSISELDISQFKVAEELDSLDSLKKDITFLIDNNPEETASGDTIVEGDIAVSRQMQREGVQWMKATINLLSLWPNGQVSYTFHPSVKPYTKAVVREALDYWEEQTCIRFKERSGDWWFIRFRTDTEGCWSFVGHIMVPFVGQDISIGPGCESRDVVVHEVGHALGFHHEQSRVDRRNAVRILWQNVRFNGLTQFTAALDSPRGVEYDLTSVMHYSPMAFTTRQFAKNTIVSVNPHHQHLIGRGRGLSFRDGKLANIVYRCHYRCPNRRSLNCDNGGYLSPYRGDGKACHCVCPPNTEGKRCQTVTGPYYPPPSCGGNVTSETTIMTPGYPVRQPEKDGCIWWIQAPVGQRIEVEFLDFSFRPRFNLPSSRFHGLCALERVEIRITDLYNGEMYCGEDLVPGSKLRSRLNNFVIIIYPDDARIGRGLKAQVRFTNLFGVRPREGGWDSLRSEPRDQSAS